MALSAGNGQISAGPGHGALASQNFPSSSQLTSQRPLTYDTYLQQVVFKSGPLAVTVGVAFGGSPGAPQIGNANAFINFYHIPPPNLGFPSIFLTSQRCWLLRRHQTEIALVTEIRAGIMLTQVAIDRAPVTLLIIQCLIQKFRLAYQYTDRLKSPGLGLRVSGSTRWLPKRYQDNIPGQNPPSDNCTVQYPSISPYENK